MRANPVPAPADELELLDASILNLRPGDEAAFADALRRRAGLLADLCAAPPSPATLDALGAALDRSARLAEMILHWRRTAHMELAAVEQHLRYLADQRPAGAGTPSRTIEISG